MALQDLKALEAGGSEGRQVEELDALRYQPEDSAGSLGVLNCCSPKGARSRM